jgi:hypothetical protein
MGTTSSIERGRSDEIGSSRLSNTVSGGNKDLYILSYGADSGNR